MPNEVNIIPSFNIDRVKWDRCICGSDNGLIYASSAWLDHMADHWSGIVLNDYEMVMPVPWRMKFGMRYSYQVPFIQQLGIFCGKKITDEELFKKALFSLCRYGDYSFNFSNSIGETEPFVNFILPFNEEYAVLSKRFSTDVIQNIRRSEGQDLHYEKCEIDEAVHCYQQLYGKVSEVTDEHFSRFRNLCFFIGENDKIIARKVTGHDHSLLAFALLPKDKRRVYNLINGTFPEGKKCEANYFLLSRLFMEFEKSGLVFDFEGSDLPGVKEFYRKFGASNQPYYKLHFNHLPWPLKFLKK
ncbi:MAG TPA: hypothetical protein VM101_07595 [Flavitalea sp.]|nr:hypothetical protein [Flavitalea sp.]